MRKKWECWICGEVFPTKKELIEDLISEWEEAAQNVDEIMAELELLGYKGPFKY